MGTADMCSRRTDPRGRFPTAPLLRLLGTLALLAWPAFALAQAGTSLATTPSSLGAGLENSLPAPRPLQGAQEPPYAETPARAQVFRTESEAALLSSWQRAGPGQNKIAELPPDAPLPHTLTLPPRHLAPAAATIIPYVVCYRPLYFEQKNVERYGRTLGVVQPLVSTGKFYLDTLLLPYHMLVLPPWACECNTGYCLPGDPVPFLLYLPACPLPAGWLTGSPCGGCNAVVHTAAP